MKKLLILILTLLLAGKTFSQKKEDLNAVAEAAVDTFKWDIQQTEKGTLMFLDVPYIRDGQESAEYLSLTVAKNKSEERPAFISAIIPNNIVQSNGIFIKFAKTITKNGEQTIELEEGNPIRVKFEKCNSEDCTARMVNGYATDENGQKEDVFKKLADFDHVLFLFVYPDGSHKSVAVPLYSFKQQYKSI